MSSTTAWRPERQLAHALPVCIGDAGLQSRAAVRGFAQPEHAGPLALGHDLPQALDDQHSQRGALPRGDGPGLLQQRVWNLYGWHLRSPVCD